MKWQEFCEFMAWKLLKELALRFLRHQAPRAGGRRASAVIDLSQET